MNNNEPLTPKHKGQTMACRVCGTSWDSEQAKACPMCFGSKKPGLDVINEMWQTLNEERRVIVAKLDALTVLQDKLRR